MMLKFFSSLYDKKDALFQIIFIRIVVRIPVRHYDDNDILFSRGVYRLPRSF